jgi:hypothetical protein
MAKKIGGRRRNYITKLAQIAVAYLVRNYQKQISQTPFRIAENKYCWLEE